MTSPQASHDGGRRAAISSGVGCQQKLTEFVNAKADVGALRQGRIYSCSCIVVCKSGRYGEVEVLPWPSGGRAASNEIGASFLPLPSTSSFLKPESLTGADKGLGVIRRAEK